MSEARESISHTVDNLMLFAGVSREEVVTALRAEADLVESWED